MMTTVMRLLREGTTFILLCQIIVVAVALPKRQIRERVPEIWRPGNMTAEEWYESHGQTKEIWGVVVEKMKQLQDKYYKTFISDVPPPQGQVSDPVPEGSYLMDDDILLTPEQVDYLISLMPDPYSRKKRKIQPFDNGFPLAKWPFPIRYKFDGMHSESQRAAIRAAIVDWEAMTCLEFEEVPTMEPVNEPHIIFTKLSGCYSYIGRQAYIVPQQINLASNCITWHGTIAHEIGHAIGFWHEQARTDRDTYVEVINDNIKNGYQSQFMKLWAGSIEDLGVEYDLSSAMHYSSKAFSKNYGYTLKTKDPLYQNTIGQRTGLSFLDVKLANMAYCKGKCKTPLREHCQHGGYQDPLKCDRCRCPDGWAGTHCEQLQSSINAQCGGKILLEPGFQKFIRSPGYNNPGHYDNNVGCNWLFETPVGYRPVLTFTGAFGLYCVDSSLGNACFHWVEIRKEKHLGLPGPRFCCYSTPLEPLSATTNQMMVILRSNFTSSSFRRRGFQALVYAENINECEDLPCNNGGVCIDGINDYTCNCPEGFTGKNCSTESTNPCDNNPCFNGGECEPINHNTNFKCHCPLGFTGSRCIFGCGGCSDALVPGTIQPRCNVTVNTTCYRYEDDYINNEVVWKVIPYPCTKEEPICCKRALFNPQIKKCEVPKYSQWSDWSQCSESCGAFGKRHRYRNNILKQSMRDVTKGLNFRETDIEHCNFQQCPQTNDCQAARDITFICSYFPWYPPCNRPCPVCKSGYTVKDGMCTR
ncbi:unnamed protein product [Owenia fusiformis]|uniref:Metalloendopeptidase n=1 Tax=Owenia fusiformis TaxID=6347 RepID=A0A8J1YAD8_OWEFU|nr:unnamed protein product [Owenia fusiformis]